MPLVAGFRWYDCLEAMTMEITTTTMEASSGVCQAAVTTRQQLIKLPDTKNINQWGVRSKRGGKWVWNESFHFALLLLLLSIRCKAVSHSEELSLVLIDRLSKKQFYQLLYQQGRLLKHGLESLSDSFYFRNLSLLEIWLGKNSILSLIIYRWNLIAICSYIVFFQRFVVYIQAKFNQKLTNLEKFYSEEFCLMSEVEQSSLHWIWIQRRL